MSDDDSDASSLSTLSKNGFPLFPVMGVITPAATNESQRSSSSFLEAGSQALFGFWSRSNSGSSETTPKAGPAGDFRAGLDQRNFSGNSAPTACDENSACLEKTPKKGDIHEQSVDLGETLYLASSADASTSDKRSLDTRILRAMGSQMAVGDYGEAAGQTGKFKYAKMYEKALQTLEPCELSARSVFGVSELDEYNQFMKLLEIDQHIQEHLEAHKFTKNSNVLPVLDTGDFHKLYNHQSTDQPQMRARKRLPFNLPWKIKQRSRGTSRLEDTDEDLAKNLLPSSLGTEERAFLHRKLEVRHLQMISMGATLGVGLYLNIGKAFTIAGGLGTVLAMFLVGLVVLATVVSFSEMVTFVSVVDGVSGLGSRFVDESFGFAVGWLYFCSFSFGLAGEVVASVIILSYYSETEILTNAGSTAGFVTLFLLICIISNLLSIRIFGEIEYFCSLAKVLITLIGIIVMIVVNRGGIGDQGAVGFKYWLYLQSDFEHNLIFGPFRPTFNLFSTGADSESEGIGGDAGRFLSLMVAIVVAAYAYSGTEIVCIAACEAKDPRKALPSATNRVFWRILILYCLASFVVSLNIYAGDPRLLRYYSGTTGVSPSEYDTNYAINYVGGSDCSNNDQIVAGFANGSQSPWVIAFQSAGSCSWSSVVNAFIFFFALSCGISQLYVSSRTVYSLSLQHKAPGFLTKCNRFGTPYMAVLFAVIPGLLSYTCVSLQATTVFQNLTSLISSSGVFVWFALCLSFVRFYYGLKKRPDIIGRDDKSYPYRSAFQPYSAIFGLFGTSVMLLSMGFVVFIKGCWNTWFFFSSYGTLIIFVILYLGHWIIHGTSISSLEALDFDSGRREKDIYIWDGGKEYNLRKVKDLTHKIVDWMA